MYLDDLTDAEREWLRTRQRREAQAFSELLGLEAEIRAEGIALIDPDGDLADLHLPGTGTIAQAALLLVERLVDRLRPEEPGHPAVGGRLVIGVPVPEGLLPELLDELIEEYGRRSNWQRGHIEDRDGFVAAVLDLLVRMQLMAPAGPVRAGSHGLPEGYEESVADGRSVTDVSAARGRHDAADWVLLAAAARYATTVAIKPRTEQSSQSTADDVTEEPPR